jgi:replicative DNA helicase
VADVLRSEDFYRPDHRLVFEAIGQVAGAGKPADAVTVSEHLERIGRLADAGGLSYLGTLVRDTPTAANVRAYAGIVRERSLLRQLLKAGTDIAASVFNNEGETARELVEHAEGRVFAIAEQGVRGARDGAVSVQSLMPALIDQIDEWHNNPGGLRGLPTGFDEFDRKTGGLRPGDLVIVAGRPSMGKTTFAVNTAEFAPGAPASKQDDKRSTTASERMKRAHQAAAHDTWFREQVQASIDDPRASVDDAVANKEFAAKRAALAKGVGAAKKAAH